MLAAAVLLGSAATAAADDEVPATLEESPAAARDSDDAHAGPASKARKKKPPRERRRPVPDLDGRKPPGPSAGRVLLWIPRILASPLWVVTDLMIRRPVGFVVRWAERNRLPALLVDFFTFGPDRNGGIVPTVLIDFRLRASVGAYFYWRDAIVKGNKIRIHGATGGRPWWRLVVVDKWTSSGDLWAVRLDLRAARRPDRPYHGLGPLSPPRTYRFAWDRLQAKLIGTMHPWRKTAVSLWIGTTRVVFREGDCCRDLYLGDAISKGLIESPPGWDKGSYYIGYVGLESVLDTRPRDKDMGTGVVLQGYAESAVRFDSSRGGWIRYGGSLAGYVDVTGTGRVIGAGVAVTFVDPLLGGEIPFTELAAIGGQGPRPGDAPLRGFRKGRLRDRSTAAAWVDYEWPIWVRLNGNLRFEVGSVYGPRLENFDPDLLRMSFGIGIRTTRFGSVPFEVLVAFGTEPFSEKAKLESFRLLIGSTRAF